MTTTHRVLEFKDDAAAALDALESIADGKGWCNLTPEIDSNEVDVLTPSVFSLRIKRGAPVASYVTSPPKKGERRPSTLGVLHTRGRLGKARVEGMLDGAPLALRQDHMQRGLLFDVPNATTPVVLLDAMRSLLTVLCDYERSGTWRMDVYERA